jgi:hypothetical protein
MLLVRTSGVHLHNHNEKKSEDFCEDIWHSPARIPSVAEKITAIFVEVVGVQLPQQHKVGLRLARLRKP